MMGVLMSMTAATSVLTKDSSLVRGDGLFPCFFPLVYPLEAQHETER